MPLKSDASEEPTLNLTPMIDVVFLLIIFFMVGSRFADLERQYDINLPSVSDAPQPLTNAPDEITINVSRDGVIMVKQQQVTLAELEAELLAARQNYPDQAVLVRGDGGGLYQHVMDVLSICQKTQIAHVSLANQIRKENQP